MEFFQLYIDKVSSLPIALAVVIGVLLWAASAIFAINVAFGKNSLFMYKQLEYATHPRVAPTLFMIGWALWPIALIIVYGIFVVPMLWNTIKENAIRVGWGIIKYSVPTVLLAYAVLTFIGVSQ